MLIPVAQRAQHCTVRRPGSNKLAQVTLMISSLSREIEKRDMGMLTVGDKIAWADKADGMHMR